MTTVEEDILKDIPDEDLPKLAKMYEKHKDQAPHVYSTIMVGIDWKKRNTHYMTFMSPNNCWKEDGTFFVLVQYFCFDIFIYTLDKSGKNVYEALRNTKRLETDHSDSGRLFFSIDDKLYPVVVKVMQEKKLEFREIPNYMYACSREKALKFDTECPPEVYIKKLEKGDASIINEVWPHKYKNSEKLIELLIELNGGYGIFLKHNNELVSWVVLSMLGQLAYLQTKEGYKHNGYASLIVKYISTKLANRGHKAFGTVLVQNVGAIKMFEKLGFQKIGSCTYAIFP